MVGNVRGSLTIPCLLICLTVVTTGFGIWGVLRQWRHRVERQLNLDECVGRQLLAFRSALNTAESSNQRMKFERKAAIVAALVPEALAMAQATLLAEEAIQEGLRSLWLGKEALWRAGRSCGNDGGFAIRFPQMDWERLPPDELGPQPFSWPLSSKESNPVFQLEVRQSGMSSAGEVAQFNGEGNAASTLAKVATQKWQARWIPSLGTSFN